eukprot:TRINITY_DN59544_c0_g1_i1.p1 TRINITY_DN59544_c0_g1~~TRINITY_DN59544_c0_g1_i1.p1  ORF type:complete len:1129 (-),score=294.76 TRINITY_DN59544_c0_g1_i1:207-3593(-)
MSSSARKAEDDANKASAKAKLLQLFQANKSLKLGTLSLSTLETALAQPQLQVLDLKDNKIASVPAEVFAAFPQVKCLDLRKNGLEALLPEIALMSSLEDLLLDQNRLKDIPVEVCSLPNLKTLSLSQNVLRSLPTAIGKMSALRSLSVGDNHIEEIPEELSECSELQCLYIHHNHFSKLPTSLHKLSNLNELALEWFRYTTPPLPRVIKGSEWKRIITKFVTVCKEYADRNEPYLTCISILGHFSQKTFDPNAIDSKRRTRLHVACLEGHVGVAMSLAGNPSSKCDSLDCEGYSPLLVAVREEHPEIATSLVKSKVDVNCGGGLFGSPLHVATVNFDPQMVMLLINGKADVNLTDADGNTPLHVLMSVFDKGGKKAGAIGQILLRSNADCNLMNSDKWAPLHLAARRGQLRGICFVMSHIDASSAECLKGTCNHQASSKKSKSSRVRTCTRAFDLNLRGGSHLWTLLHLAGHAGHVPVVQVLIEAGADVFQRNIDGRTARHVSRGNLAISKLLRKAEDEWLWYRIRHAEREGSPPPTCKPVVDNGKSSANGGDDAAFDAFKVEAEDDDDAIEEIAKNIEGLSETSKNQSGDAGASKKKKKVDDGKRTDRIIEKCRDMHFTKAELQQIQLSNFGTPAATLEEFVAAFTKLAQGPKNRLPFFLSRPWVKTFLPQLLEEEKCHVLVLQPSLVANEDFIRLLICNLPPPKLTLFGKMRNKEQETILHVLCNEPTKTPVSTRADTLLLLLEVCPPGTFDLEARDARGQTALHLAAQSGDISLLQVLLEHGADPNAQEETTGWSPLHFAVAKAHYHLIIQLLHHEATNVNQVDNFDWPPLLEACSRLDARTTSLLVNGGASLTFKNQHAFDVLKAVDTSKKDLAAKRWMSCLSVSNGFRFEDSTVQLNQEDRDTLERERQFFATRQTPPACPPFFVPDHLAPRCMSCKVLFSMTVSRNRCRSCGVVICVNCIKTMKSNIVSLDERVRFGHRLSRAASAALTGPAAPQRGAKPQAAVGSSAAPGGTGAAATNGYPAGSPNSALRSLDGAEGALPLPEELPAVGPPSSSISPASMMFASLKGDGMHGKLRRESCATAEKTPARNVIVCACCAVFYENGVGETYGMIERKGPTYQAV